MKKILLKNGGYTLVSDEDYYDVKCFFWGRTKERKTSKGYVRGYINGKEMFLHRFIMKPGKGMVVDHKNGDVLDNTRDNLRVCTNQENSRNRTGKQKNNTSGYNGVQKQGNGWQAQIKVNGKKKYLGYSKDLVYLAKLYDKYAKIYHGEFATLNFK